MKNSTNQTITSKLHVCAGCGQTGGVGAKWLLYVDGNPQPKMVHKPCGEVLVKSAPPEVNARLIPSRQLRDEWRMGRMAKNFWGAAFNNAKPLKPKPAPAAQEQKPVLMTVTVPPPMMVAQAA